VNSYRASTPILSALLTAGAAWASSVNPPALTYTSASVVNAASYLPGALAPNTIATVFGTNLSFGTTAVTAGTLYAGGLPLSLGGVTVYIDGGQCGLYYVSPTQINLLIPNHLNPGTLNLVIGRDGLSGPNVPITLDLTAPTLFADNNGNAIATHLDGTLLTSSAPAQPGEWIVIYCLGLGRTIPDALDFMPAVAAAPMIAANFKQLVLTLNGEPVDPAQVNYAGATPGESGLYQINLKIPDAAPSNPQIVVSIGPSRSQANVQLFVNGN
jgi:uncharacterized protein (TIGR03437 family)